MRGWDIYQYILQWASTGFTLCLLIVRKLWFSWSSSNHLFMSLSVCLSVRPSVYLTPLCLLCLSICLLHLYIHLFFYLCVSGLSVLLYTYSLIYCAVYLCFSVDVSFCLPPTSLPPYRSICLSVYLCGSFSDSRVSVLPTERHGEKYKTVPFLWLAWAWCAEEWRGNRWSGRSGAEDIRTTRRGGTDHSSLQVNKEE